MAPRPRPLLIEAVLLDVDGTLLDTNRLHAEAWSEILGELGVAASAREIHPLIGMGGKDLARQVSHGRLSPAQLEVATERHEELFRSKYLRRAKPIRGARELLKDLRRLGVRAVVASSGKKEQVEALLRRLRVTSLVEGATDADDVSRPKPAPDIFRAAIRKFRLPRSAVVIGDTPYDVRAARAAGLEAIAVLTGGHGRRALRGAARIYRTVADVRRELVTAVR